MHGHHPATEWLFICMDIGNLRLPAWCDTRNLQHGRLGASETHTKLPVGLLPFFHFKLASKFKVLLTVGAAPVTSPAGCFRRTLTASFSKPFSGASIVRYRTDLPIYFLVFSTEICHNQPPRRSSSALLSNRQPDPLSIKCR
jgi:hypothetical protein